MAGTRTFYSEKDAEEALKNFEESGLSRRRYAKLTGIPESTIRDCRGEENHIKKAADQVAKEMSLKRAVSRVWIWRWKKANEITYRIPTKVGRKTKNTDDDIKAMERYEAQLEEIHQQSWWTNFDLAYLKGAFPVKDMQVTQVLLRDHCKADLSQNSADLLQERGVQQLLIPKGKTGDKQPLDVGVNGPFEAIPSRIYHKWMDNRTALTKSGYLKKPSRQDFLNFVSQAWEEVSPLIIESSFVTAGVLPEPTYMLADYVSDENEPFEFDFSD